jgi:hypothetical protein
LKDPEPKEKTVAKHEHEEAASHHENAAKAHRSAAEHHGKGSMKKERSTHPRLKSIPAKL